MEVYTRSWENMGKPSIDEYKWGIFQHAMLDCQGM